MHGVIHLRVVGQAWPACKNKVGRYDMTHIYTNVNCKACVKKLMSSMHKANKI